MRSEMREGSLCERQMQAESVCSEEGQMGR